MPEALASLLSPLSVAEFRSQYYAQQSVYIGGNPDKFRALFDLPSLRRILNFSPIPHPTMKLVREGQRLTASDASAVLEHCRAGATLIIEEIDKYDARVGTLGKTLASEFGERTRTNLYYSQPNRPGFNRHYDTHDVFILQIDGLKGWRVFDHTTKFPLFVQKHHDRDAPDTACVECTLSPGDVLYIPRGHWHEATAQLEPSLHLTLGLFARTGIDFLTWLVDELRDDVRWRDAFPLSFADELPADGRPPERAVGHFRGLGTALFEVMSDEETLARYRLFCIAQDKPLQPFSVAVMDGAARGFEQTDTFERPAYQRYALSIREDVAQVVVWGHVLTFDCQAGAALRFIFSRTAFAFHELCERTEVLSAAEVEEILRVLLEHGIVTRR
jgi:ribosomal protein L16 Arg81 hydroxylase